MEEFSRRVLTALVVAAAGPGAAMLTFMLLAPAAIVATAPETDGDLVARTGSLLVGAMIGGLLTAVVAYLVGSAATMLALRATHCPKPHLALVLCLVLTPPWVAVLSGFDLDATSFVLLLGLLPGGVRLAFGEQQALDDRADDLAPPPSARLG